MAELGLIFGGVLGLVFLFAILIRWNELWLGGKGLPGGTMGWPLFGETIQFLKHGPNFMKNRKLRYGSLFKTHILGCPTVVSMDPDVNRFILMNEGKGVTPGYPQPMQDILGKWNIIFVQGALHKSMRGALLSLISPGAIKEELLPKISSFMLSYLRGLGGQTVNIQEITREMLIRLAIKLTAGMETEPAADILVKELSKLICGTLSLPIYLPGSNYRRAFKAREKIVSILQDVVRERRGSSSGEKRDILQSLLQVEQKADHRLTDEQIIDFLISIVFAAFETTPATSMMAFKYLHDHPRALQQAREEHLNIRRRKSAGEKIEWEDYASMSFTRAVILETLRLATIVNGVLRKTTEDLEINGFTIPGGWKIYVYIRENNYDPFQYPEPLQFNPWRWQDKSLESHHNFMIFGGGQRLCLGKELGIVQVSMFLHVLLTRYRWEAIGGEKISYFPRVEAPNGLHYRVFDL